MTVLRSRPKRPAWLYPIGSVLTLRDGRRFRVYEQEIQMYHEFGTLGNPKDYLYSKWKRMWEEVEN